MLTFGVLFSVCYRHNVVLFYLSIFFDLSCFSGKASSARRVEAPRSREAPGGGSEVEGGVRLLEKRCDIYSIINCVIC